MTRLLTIALLVSACASSPQERREAGIETWSQNHPAASQELGLWVRSHPEAAALFFEWDGHHPPLEGVRRLDHRPSGAADRRLRGDASGLAILRQDRGVASS